MDSPWRTIVRIKGGMVDELSRGEWGAGRAVRKTRGVGEGVMRVARRVERIEE